MEGWPERGSHVKAEVGGDGGGGAPSSLNTPTPVEMQQHTEYIALQQHGNNNNLQQQRKTDTDSVHDEPSLVRLERISNTRIFVNARIVSLSIIYHYW